MSLAADPPRCATGCRRAAQARTATATPPETVEIHLVRNPGDPDRPLLFDPDEVVVRTGGLVRWVNDHDIFHTITSTDSLAAKQPSGAFDHTLSSADEAVEIRFEEPGTYAFYCQPHADFMQGVVRVVE